MYRRSQTSRETSPSNSTTTMNKYSSTLSSAEEDFNASKMSTFLSYSFIFISFGYMLPWTALGSLISYFKYVYSAQFYVKLYCAYYLPGLPVAIIQYL